MDPLSVMASVVGLMTAASNVSSVLLAVKSNMKDAPQMVNHVLSEVKEVEISLSAIQKFLMGITSAPRRRIALIQLDQLIATLTEAVLTFSELEGMVTPLASKSNAPTLERLRWALKEDKVSSIMQRLQRHKSSLSLMLNIVQCGSDLEAERSRETLQDLVEQLLESSHDISTRLRSIENSCDSQTTLTRYLTNDSTEPTEVDDSSIAPDAMDMNDVGLKSFDFQFTTTEITVTETMATDSTTTESTTIEVSFENDLKLSRVYSRTQLYKSDVSFTSSAVRTHAWSVYSGLSLAEASVISAIALPLYSHDISNSHRYKFGDGNQTDPHRPKTVSNAPPTLSEARNPLRKSTSAVSKIRNYASELRPFPRRKSAPSGSSEVSKMRLHRLVVLGDGGVGKYELINQLCLKIFIESYDAPIGDSFREQITIDGEPCMLEVLDTAGQEEYTALRDQWIRDGEGFVLVYSVCSRSSFTKIRKFHHQVSKVKESVISEFFNLPYVPMMIVGNNCDQMSEREVSTLEGHALAKELGCEFIETSAKSGVNVEKAFFDVVRLLRRRRR